MNDKKILFIVVLVVIFIRAPLGYAQELLEEKLRQHVYTLADDSLVGRKAGTVYAKKAADYIAAQWEEIGLTHLVGDSYRRPFQFNQFCNLAAFVEGNDPVLKEEYIIIGAHYDHIGGMINNKGETVIFNGADDNASGVAVLIEVGRRLKEAQSTLGRSIVLIAFDAEELGLIGSTEFITNPPFPVEKIKLMMSIDMVGWYNKSCYVKYSGYGTINKGKQLLLNETLIPEGLQVIAQNFEKSLFTGTDTKGFAEKGIPTLCVTTGLKSPYHKPEDEAHLIDYEGMTLIAEHITHIVQALSRDDTFRASGKIASKHKSTSQFVQWGITADIGSNYHHYTAGALKGKSAIAYGIGLSGQLNMKFVAIRPEIYYNYISARHPQGAINNHAMTIPLNVMLQTLASSASGFAVYAGPYYSFILNGKQGDAQLDFENHFNREEVGYQWGLEVRVVNFRLGFTNRNALTNFSRLKNSDDAHLRNRALFLTLGYVF